MSKISNVLTMLELLSTKKKYSIQELANILEVTPRMIRIYKEDLEKAGIYIDTIMGPYGGYILNQNINIPKRKIPILNYQVLNKYIDLHNEDYNQLTHLKETLKEININNSSFKKELLLPEDIQKKYNILTRSIKEKRKVEITYHSLTKGETKRIIRPYEMFLYQNGWCCASYCELRKDIRLFELKRINNIKILNKYFE